MTSAPQPEGRPGKKKRPPRWGLRTLGFLALAIVAVITASELGHWTPGTLGCTVIGIGGAIYCSIKGIRTADLTPRREPPPEHLDPDADRWNAGSAWPDRSGSAPSAGGQPPGPAPSAGSAPSASEPPSTDETTTETDR